MNKKNIKLIVIVIFSIVLVFSILLGLSCLLWIRLDYESKERFKPSGKVYKEYEKLDNKHLYVVTKDDYNKEINYYKVNNKLKLSEANKFDYEENDILHLAGCFDSYISRDRSEVLNKFNKKNCNIRDKNWNKVSSNKDLNKIIKLVSKLKHEIIISDVIPIKDEYYVIIGLNVNFWSPYYLYKYEDNRLKKIYCFDGERIIFLKHI